MYLTSGQLAEIIAEAIQAALAKVLETAGAEPEEAEGEEEKCLGEEEYLRRIGGRMRVCKAAKRADGTQRHTTDGRSIQEVCGETEYPWGGVGTAPVLLNGMVKEMPLSLVGALFVEMGNGVCVELRNASWRERFHPLAYKESIYSVCKEGFEPEYGKLPEEPPVVETRPKKAGKGAILP